MVGKAKEIETRDSRIRQIMKKGDKARRNRFLKRQKKIDFERDVDLRKVLGDLKNELDALQGETLVQKPRSIADLHALAEEHRDYIHDLKEGVEMNLEHAFKTLERGGALNQDHLIEIGGFLGEIEDRSKKLEKLVEEIEQIKADRLGENEDLFTELETMHLGALKPEEIGEAVGFEEGLDEEELDEKELEDKEKTLESISKYLDFQQELTPAMLAEAYAKKQMDEMEKAAKARKKEGKK